MKNSSCLLHEHELVSRKHRPQVSGPSPLFATRARALARAEVCPHTRQELLTPLDFLGPVGRR